jgi:hypothetical protein
MTPPPLELELMEDRPTGKIALEVFGDGHAISCYRDSLVQNSSNSSDSMCVSLVSSGEREAWRAEWLL